MTDLDWRPGMQRRALDLAHWHYVVMRARDAYSFVYRQRHAQALELVIVIPHLLTLLCSGCVKRVGESGILTVDDDEELTEAMDALAQLILRFTAPSQRRRLLHILSAVGETGTRTTITISLDGEATADQEGMRAGFGPRDKADAKA